MKTGDKQENLRCHDLSRLAAASREEWIPISPAGTEGCLWEEDFFDYESLIPDEREPTQER